MIKKSFIAGIIVSLILISLLTGLHVVMVADANMIPIPTAEIYSPLPSTIYHNTTVMLDVCLKNRVVSNPVTKITYSLDSGYTVEFANVTRSPEYQSFNYKAVDYRAITALENLKPGNHSLVVYVLSEYRSSGNPQEIDFTVANTESSISPIPTPNHTSNLTPTTPYLPPNDRNAPHLDPTFYLLPIGIILAIIVAVIVIYRRRKKPSQRIAGKGFES
jgi:hypothetical protein